MIIIKMIIITWLQYSSDIRFAQISHNFIFRAGFDTSAHLISIRLIRMIFSGVDNSFKSCWVVVEPPLDSTWLCDCDVCVGVNNNDDVGSSMIWLVNDDFWEKTWRNFDKCSKCFVISVAKTISIIECRTSLYVSLSKFLNMFIWLSGDDNVILNAWAAWWLSKTDLKLVQTKNN